MGEIISFQHNTEEAARGPLPENMQLLLHKSGEESDESGFDRVLKRINWQRRKIGKFIQETFIKPYRRWRTPDYLSHLSFLCIKLNSSEHFAIFLNISGHVEHITLSVHPDGYDSDRNNSIQILNGRLPGFGFSTMRLKDLRLAGKMLCNMERASRIRRKNKSSMLYKP